MSRKLSVLRSLRQLFLWIAMPRPYLLHNRQPTAGMKVNSISQEMKTVKEDVDTLKPKLDTVEQGPQVQRNLGLPSQSDVD